MIPPTPPAERLRERLAAQIAEWELWDADPTAAFEQMAEAFYQETGFLAPGKSMPLEMCGEAMDQRRRRRYDEWKQERKQKCRQLLRDVLALVDAERQQTHESRSPDGDGPAASSSAFETDGPHGPLPMARRRSDAGSATGARTTAGSEPADSHHKVAERPAEKELEREIGIAKAEVHACMTQQHDEQFIEDRMRLAYRLGRLADTPAGTGKA